MLVYMAPRSYSALWNTRMLNKFTEVFLTFQLFIHATKITNFGSQQHNLFLECTKLSTAQDTHYKSIINMEAIYVAF